MGADLIKPVGDEVHWFGLVWRALQELSRPGLFSAQLENGAEHLLNGVDALRGLGGIAMENRLGIETGEEAGDQGFLGFLGATRNVGFHLHPLEQEGRAKSRQNDGNGIGSREGILTAWRDPEGRQFTIRDDKSLPVVSGQRAHSLRFSLVGFPGERIGSTGCGVLPAL